MRFLAVLLISLFVPVLANAQAVCGKRDALLKQLADGYKEAPVAMGLDSNGRVVELATSETGTWTILMTGTEGITCLVAVGKAWENIQPKKTSY